METALYWTRETLMFVLLCLAWLSPIWLPAMLLTLIPPLRWYIAWLLAKRDFIFTMVPESYFKIITRFGGHKKTLLSKKGYTINEDGDIVKLPNGASREASPLGGLGLVGWPFIDRIYRGKMKFLKSLPDGSTKSYDEESVNAFYAKVDYPYALPFVKCEDKNNLPLEGHATLLARIVNPEKSQFATANFYDTMIGLILPVVRKRLEKFAYDELKEKPDLDQLMWEELNKIQPAGLVGTEDDVNVLDELCDRYGVEIVALRIVNIDPPKEYRDATLTKWKAEREADAATAVGIRKAKETEGRVVEAVAIAAGMPRKELEAIIKAKPELRGLSAEKGGYKEDFAHNRDLVKREEAGEGLEDVRVGNVDGTPLEPVLAGLAAMFGLGKSKGSRRAGPAKKNSGSGSRGRKKKNPTHLDEADDDDVF